MKEKHNRLFESLFISLGLVVVGTGIAFLIKNLLIVFGPAVLISLIGFIMLWCIVYKILGDN